MAQYGPSVYEVCETCDSQSYIVIMHTQVERKGDLISEVVSVPA